MAFLTRPTAYNIEDSNIALLGSDIEKRVREHSGSEELAWEIAGSEPGLMIWRIESFQVVEWPKARYGTFYDGDSYIVLHTYKKNPETDALSYDLHFWLGRDTSQDEAGTAAYKTVELDDYLGGRPVQYREIQGSESERFLSYFARFVCLHGGIDTGFHQVVAPPPLDILKLYMFSLSSAPARSVVIREIPVEAGSLVNHDVFVLDKGQKVLQLNTLASSGIERFKAAEFVRSIADERNGECEVIVYEEGASGASLFLAEFGIESNKIPLEATKDVPSRTQSMVKISDSSGRLTFEAVAPSFKSLTSDDAYIFDDSSSSTFPAVFIWLGEFSSPKERKFALQHAQAYINSKGQGRKAASVPIIRMREGAEMAEFMDALPVE
ncbi:hypothetical protein ONZ45_g11530 [Pleurotus djamor]|nr:hypothetical protein ONZ45_g11530 [Pleurotus djamor]